MGDNLQERIEEYLEAVIDSPFRIVNPNNKNTINVTQLIRDMQERIEELEADLNPAQILLQKYSVDLLKLEEENARLLNMQP